MNIRVPNRKLTTAQRRRVRSITRALQVWYSRRRRDLPWRRDRDPYRVWISEIMLQQTQVKTVVPYYERFMTRFPTVASLAKAEEDTVLEQWAGLGYYSRGRNLWRAAQQIVREHTGRLPEQTEGLRALPGVGEYTAAAIGSIAFGHRVAVIDGNVERVLARYLALDGDPKKGESKARLREAADLAVPDTDCGDHNQAMMELGATVCTPRSPNCDECPVATGCRARKLGRSEAYPPPRKRRAQEVQHWLAAVIRAPSGTVIRRAATDAPFLRGQWGVPLWPLEREPSRHRVVIQARELVEREFEFDTQDGEYRAEVRHQITYRSLRVHVVVLETGVVEGRTIDPHDAAKLPGLHRKILLAAAE